MFSRKYATQRYRCVQGVSRALFSVRTHTMFSFSNGGGGGNGGPGPSAAEQQNSEFSFRHSFERCRVRVVVGGASVALRMQKKLLKLK